MLRETAAVSTETDPVPVQTAVRPENNTAVNSVRESKDELETDFLSGQAQCPKVLRPATGRPWPGGATGNAFAYKMFAASSASSERSPFCNSMCAAIAWSRNRLTT